MLGDSIVIIFKICDEYNDWSDTFNKLNKGLNVHRKIWVESNKLSKNPNSLLKHTPIKFYITTEHNS